MFNGEILSGASRTSTASARRASRSPSRSNRGRQLKQGRQSSSTVGGEPRPFTSQGLIQRTETKSSSEVPGGILQIGAVRLLSRRDEVQLAAAIRRGDEAARERMIRANLRLVLKIARDYEHLGLPLADLVSEGTIGLMKAVDRFKPSKGGKLSTYGAWWIKQQIRRALANQGRTVRLPVHVEGKLYRLSRAEARLRNTLGRDATDEELALELNTTTRRIARLRESSVRPASLDALVGDSDSASIGDLVADEQAPNPYIELERKLDHERLRQLLGSLTDREAKILTLRFGLHGGEEQTLEDVGREFNLTRERIRQVQNEAFRKLRGLLESPGAQLQAA